MRVDVLYKTAHVGTNVSAVETLRAWVGDWDSGLWRLDLGRGGRPSGQ